MTDTLRIKRRPAGGAAGAPTSLSSSEIAFNEVDDTLWYGKGNSGGLATSIIPIAGAGAFPALGDGRWVKKAGDQMSAGLSFGSRTVDGDTGINNPLNLTRHLSLFDGWGGFSVTSGNLNLVSGGMLTMRFNGPGAMMGTGARLYLDTDPTDPLEAVPLRYLQNNYSTNAQGDTRWVNTTGDTMTGQLTVNSDLTVQGNTAVTGFKFWEQNTGPMAGGGYGALTWNTDGGGDVAFVNGCNWVPAGFSWYNVLSPSGWKRTMFLEFGGILSLSGPGIKYTLGGGGTNAMGFKWTGSRVDSYVDGSLVGTLAYTGDFANYTTTTDGDTRWVNVTGDTVTGSLGVNQGLTVGTGGSIVYLTINGLSGSGGAINFLSNSTNRWLFGMDGYPVTGAGTDAGGVGLALYSYNNNGSFRGTALTIARDTWHVSLGGPLSIANNQNFQLMDTAGTGVRFIVGSDNHFGVYSANAAGAVTSIWDFYARTDGPSQNFWLRTYFQFMTHHQNGLAWATTGGDFRQGSLYSDPNWGGLFRAHPGLLADLGFADRDGNIMLRIRPGWVEFTEAVSITNTAVTLTLSKDPTADMHAATRLYVDGAVTRAGGPFLPTAGGAMTAAIQFNNSGNNNYIGQGADGVGAVNNNIKIASWWGVGFYNNVGVGSVPGGQAGIWFDTREGNATFRNVTTTGLYVSADSTTHNIYHDGSVGIMYRGLGGADWFAFKWDGSYSHIIVNGGDQGTLATQAWANTNFAAAGALGNYVVKAGDVMTGQLRINFTPTNTAPQLWLSPNAGNAGASIIRFNGTFAAPQADQGPRYATSIRSGQSTTGWGGEYLDVWITDQVNDVNSDARQTRAARFMLGGTTFDTPVTINRNLAVYAAGDPMHIIANSGNWGRYFSTVTGVRTWAAGTAYYGNYVISDENVPGVRFQIDTSGNVEVSAGNLTILNGGINLNNGVSGPQNASRGITFWGSPTGPNYSIVVSGSRLNYNVNNTTDMHDFYSGGVLRLSVSDSIVSSAPVTVNNAVQVNGQLSTGGWLRAAYNTSVTPAPDAAGLISWNRSQGSGEVNFYNGWNGGGTVFDWRQVTGVGTEKTLASLSSAGGLTLAGTLQVMPTTGNAFFAQNGAKINRIADRLFVGPATANDGAYPNVGKDWLQEYFASTIAGGTVGPMVGTMMSVLSSNGQFGFVSGSRSSDNPTAGSMNTIGIASFVINDNTTSESTVYAYYGEARRMPAVDEQLTICMELDVSNQSYYVPPTPYAQLPGSTYVHQIASGCGIPWLPYTANTTAGINFRGNPTKFGTGILFGADSIVGTDGYTGAGAAISLAKGHSLVWYAGDGHQTCQIQGGVNDYNTAMNMIFSDSGVDFTKTPTGYPLVRIPPIANPVNWLVLAGAVAGGAVGVLADGLDANINLVFRPRGGGYIDIATPQSSFANAGGNGALPAQVYGYIVILLGGTPVKIPFYAP